MELEKLSLKVRQNIVRKAIEVGTGHIASALSIVEILVVLFFEEIKDHRDGKLDNFILSKGHSAFALYSCLLEKGYISREDFDSYHKNGGKLTSFPSEPFFKGLDFSSGSLGHGLSTACGIALAHKIAGASQRVYCLLSDGECQEGSVWEAALFAAHQELNNLCVIIDVNRLQALGGIQNILEIEPLAKKWESFGFNVSNVDAHKIPDLQEAFASFRESEKPVCILANSVKGKGLSFMENQFDWHYLPIKGEFIEKATKELNL